MNVGVMYEDLDLKTLNTEELKNFGRSIIKDNVVVVRNQQCNEQDILRICETFGAVLKPKQFFMHPDYPGLFRVTNRRENGEKIGIFADKELDWHSNGNGRPSGKESCVALYCIEPGENSITSFCDTRRAYKDLPDDIKEIVDDVDCTFQFQNNTFYKLDADDKELIMFENKHIYPEGVTKPLVYNHPWDHDGGLYFTFHYIRKMWRRSGKPLDENWLKQYLFDHIFQEKYIYHHDDWRPGDFIFMDQFHSIHKRNEVQGDRLLYRISFNYEGLFNE
jgi:alpha-ketoglutarate-dependent 2,4-dichlorophenoxyacetate dioxygenase